jgi:hypothetical protein
LKRWVSGSDVNLGDAGARPHLFSEIENYVVGVGMAGTEKIGNENYHIALSPFMEPESRDSSVGIVTRLKAG